MKMVCSPFLWFLEYQILVFSPKALILFLLSVEVQVSTPFHLYENTALEAGSVELLDICVLISKDCRIKNSVLVHTNLKQLAEIPLFVFDFHRLLHDNNSSYR
jgi:hypothetical protein